MNRRGFLGSVAGLLGGLCLGGCSSESGKVLPEPRLSYRPAALGEGVRLTEDNWFIGKPNQGYFLRHRYKDREFWMHMMTSDDGKICKPVEGCEVLSIREIYVGEAYFQMMNDRFPTS